MPYRSRAKRPGAQLGTALGKRPRGARRLARLLAGCAVLAGCPLLAACEGAELKPVPSYDPTVYYLGVQDQLRVVTYGDEQLTRDFRVNENGQIAMPLIGSIDAAGLTTSQLADRIAAALVRRQILKNPSVSVEVENFRPISVLGEVVKPGLLPYQPGMTMLTAVAAAGGFTYRGVQGYAYVIREEAHGHVIGRLEPQDNVKPGDNIKIYERTF